MAMKIVFKKMRAECFICTTPVDGRNKRGDRFYCASHFEITSEQEKQQNEFQDKRKRNYDKIFGS